MNSGRRSRGAATVFVAFGSAVVLLAGLGVGGCGLIIGLTDHELDPPDGPRETGSSSGGASSSSSSGATLDATADSSGSGSSSGGSGSSASSSSSGGASSSGSSSGGGSTGPTSCASAACGTGTSCCFAPSPGTQCYDYDPTLANSAALTCLAPSACSLNGTPPCFVEDYPVGCKGGDCSNGQSCCASLACDGKPYVCAFGGSACGLCSPSTPDGGAWTLQACAHASDCPSAQPHCCNFEIGDFMAFCMDESLYASASPSVCH
jgi:hypothetical protein